MSSLPFDVLVAAAAAAIALKKLRDVWHEIREERELERPFPEASTTDPSPPARERARNELTEWADFARLEDEIMREVVGRKLRFYAGARPISWMIWRKTGEGCIHIRLRIGEEVHEHTTLDPWTGWRRVAFRSSAIEEPARGWIAELELWCEEIIHTSLAPGREEAGQG